MPKFTIPRTIQSVVEQSRRIADESTFVEFMRFMQAHVPAPGKKHVGAFTRMGVQQFQNWQLDENPRLRLSDAQLLAVMRVEFPLNEGTVFSGAVDAGLKIVSGIRAHYNRDGHHGPSPQSRGLPASISYGQWNVDAPEWSLRFDPGLIRMYAKRYSYSNPQERDPAATIAPVVREHGFYTRRQFMAVCRWKSPRPQKRCALNDRRTVEILTRAALTSAEERVRIETLTTLQGVSWPTASVLLHFGHEDEYPILDYRALWSLGVDPPPPYDFDVWWRYVKLCRDLADQNGVSVRTLDKALWQYSKEHQG